MYIIEHVTYRHGDKQGDETACDSMAMAVKTALRFLGFGGRVWINNIEYTERELLQWQQT